MKLPLLALSLLIAGSLTATITQAATSGTLTVRGQINGGTCNLDTIGAVTLPTVKISDFGSSGWTGRTTFDVNATCESDIKNVTFLISGTQATGAPTYWASTGTAGGVASILRFDHTGGYDIPANGTPERRSRTVQTSASKARLPMAAYYQRIGTLSKGTLVTTATVSITYN